VIVADSIVLLILAFDCVKGDRLIVWLARKLSAAGGIVDKIGEGICEIVEVVDMRADKKANADSGGDMVENFGKDVDGKSNDRDNARGDGRGDNRGSTGFGSKPNTEVSLELDGAVDREVDDEIDGGDMSCGLDDSTGVKLEVDEGVIGRILEEVDEKGDPEAQEMLSKGAGRVVEGEVDGEVDGATEKAIDSEIVERPVDEVNVKICEVLTAVSGVV
jgi:hypothetical protein